MSDEQGTARSNGAISPAQLELARQRLLQRAEQRRLERTGARAATDEDAAAPAEPSADDVREAPAAPSEPVAAESAAPGARGRSIEERVVELEAAARRAHTRNGELVNRIFAIQKAVVEQMKLTVCPLGVPGSEIFPIEVLERPEAPTRVFAFGSMGHNFGIVPKQFFKSLSDRDCEIYFLKDFRQCWYQRGLLGLTDSVGETADYLRGLMRDDPRPVAMVGASAGAFAAILFGCLLGAHRVVAFSPQTHITRQVLGKFRTNDTNDEDIDMEAVHTDLVKVATAHPPKGVMDVYFAEHTTYDGEQARRLEGIDGVRLLPLRWKGHNTASFLKSRDRLDEVLDDLASGGDARPGVAV